MLLMNKKVLAVIVVVILLLLGGWYFMNSKKGTTTTSTQTATGTSQPSAVSSLKDLISKGVAQSCTYSNAATTGTIYVSGGTVRGDFDTTTDKTTTKSHMIVKDNTSYIWTDGQATGFKMSFDPNATPAAGAGSSAPSGGVDASATMNYKCSAWAVDGSKFDLPTGVTFQTFAIPSQAAPAQGTSGSSSSQCSYCDSLSGDSKTQCLTALKCN
jgi:cytoskeletal protein RodZ